MACFVRLVDRAVLAVSGSDADGFLQGLITNDVEKLRDGSAIHAALLTPQGKYLFDFLVFRRESAFCLDCEAEARPALAKRLAMYKLRADVTIDAAVPDTICAVFGDDAEGAAQGSRTRKSSSTRVTRGWACVRWACSTMTRWSAPGWRKRRARITTPCASLTGFRDGAAGPRAGEVVPARERVRRIERGRLRKRLLCRPGGHRAG